VSRFQPPNRDFLPVFRLKQFHDTHNVLVFFPPESLEKSSLLLVYDPTSPSASPSPLVKSKNLDVVANGVLKMVKEMPDIKSQLIEVEKKWHSAVIGRSGTALDKIIGEDITLLIKFGTEAGGATEDFIMVKGMASEVDRAVKDIKAAVEEAIENSFVRDVSRRGFWLADAHLPLFSPPSSKSIRNTSVGLSALMVHGSTGSGNPLGLPSNSTRNLTHSRRLQRRKRRSLHKSLGSRSAPEVPLRNVS
jgi:hypothetical protein